MNTLQVMINDEGSVSKEGYGKCPVCGGKGVERERCPGGKTVCENGHIYPSNSSVYTKPSKNIELDLIPVGAKVAILDWALAVFEGVRPQGDDWEFHVENIEIYLDKDRVLVSYSIYAHSNLSVPPQVQVDKEVTFHRVPADNLKQILKVIA